MSKNLNSYTIRKNTNLLAGTNKLCVGLMFNIIRICKNVVCFFFVKMKPLKTLNIVSLYGTSLRATKSDKIRACQSLRQIQIDGVIVKP